MKAELTSHQRARLREQGYADGRAGREKASDNPEYRTSYRRGAEARRKEVKT
jgi:hypothetical protein